jgi:hypothetical protein
MAFRLLFVGHEEQGCGNVEGSIVLSHHLLGPDTVNIKVFFFYGLLDLVEHLQDPDLLEVPVARDKVGLYLDFRLTLDIPELPDLLSRTERKRPP